ncbi:MAG: hypothetical protein AAFX06_00745 [Planctomycetota bacterium]
MSETGGRFAAVVADLKRATRCLEDGAPKLHLLLSNHGEVLEHEFEKLHEQGMLQGVFHDVLQQLEKLEESKFSKSSIREFDDVVFELLIQPTSKEGAVAIERVKEERRVADARLAITPALGNSLQSGPSFSRILRRSLGFAENFDSESVVWHPEDMDRVTVTEDGQDIDYVAQASTALSLLSRDGIRTVLDDLSEESLRMVLSICFESPAALPIIENNNPGLGTAVKQMLAEGVKSLTRDELRKLQTFAANRLKEDEFDQRVKERAIEEDIFPLANALFPDRIASPSDIDADSLTALFSEKADDPAYNVEPLTDDQLLAIKDLSQAWRKHFWHVKYRQKPVNLTPAREDGLKFRTPGRKPESMGTNKFWPKLDFSPDNT